jgi:hypothetical protein
VLRTRPVKAAIIDSCEAIDERDRRSFPVNELFDSFGFGKREETKGR